jgi:hypothetical protein
MGSQYQCGSSTNGNASKLSFHSGTPSKANYALNFPFVFGLLPQMVASSLEYLTLMLDSNRLTAGTLPTQIAGLLTSLINMNLENNALTSGTIPSMFCDCGG